MNTGSGDLDRLYIAVRSDLRPGLAAAQAVHAAFHFHAEWSAMADRWMSESNFLVVVAVPDEQALLDLSARAGEEGIVSTLVHEPDLGDQATAVALQPGPEARRLCANLPLFAKDSAMT